MSLPKKTVERSFNMKSTLIASDLATTLLLVADLDIELNDSQLYGLFNQIGQVVFVCRNLTTQQFIVQPCSANICRKGTELLFGSPENATRCKVQRNLMEMEEDTAPPWMMKMENALLFADMFSGIAKPLFSGKPISNASTNLLWNMNRFPEPRLNTVSSLEPPLELLRHGSQPHDHGRFENTFEKLPFVFPFPHALGQNLRSFLFGLDPFSIISNIMWFSLELFYLVEVIWVCYVYWASVHSQEMFWAKEFPP